MIGWGRLEYNGALPGRLRQGVVPILSHEHCRHETQYLASEITDNMMCAKTKGGDACFGDSGGPLTMASRGRSVLVGVVSWGRECARPQWPGVYSKVDTVLHWIKENTYDAEWCAEAAIMSHDNRGDRRADR